MKLDPSNPFESQLWRDVFLSWLKDWGGPDYTDSGNEQVRIAAGRHADLAVETMRERMPAPRDRDLPDELVELEAAKAPREVLPADERITPVVLAWLRALACALATPRAREYLFDLFAVVEAAHCGLVSRETALCDDAWSKLEAFARSSKSSADDVALVRAVSLAVDRDIRRLSDHPNDMWTAYPVPEQASAATLTETPESFRQTSESEGRARERADVLDFMRHPPGSVTDSQRRFRDELVNAIERGTHAGCASRRLHVAPGWVSSAAGIRKAIDGAADRGDVIVVDIRVDDENVAQWVLSVPEQAEALVAALLSVGVEP